MFSTRVFYLIFVFCIICLLFTINNAQEIKDDPLSLSKLATLKLASLKGATKPINKTDIDILNKLVKTKTASIPMLKLIINSVDAHLGIINKTEPELCEEYFLGQLNSVKPISTEVFYKYAKTVSNITNVQEITRAIKMKAEDDPYNLMSLFYDWAVQLQSITHGFNQMKDLPEWDKTFISAKRRWQVRQNLEANTKFQINFDAYQISKNNPAISPRDTAKYLIELLKIIKSELLAIDVSDPQPNTLCQVSTIDSMIFALQSLNISRPLVNLIGKISLNSLYIYDVEYLTEYMKSYMQDEMVAITMKYINALKKDNLDAAFNMTPEHVLLYVLKWYSAVIESANNITDVNIWLQMSHLFKYQPLITESLNDRILRPTLIEDIEKKLPIVLYAVNIANGNPEELKLMKSANTSLYATNTSIETLKYISNYLTMSINPNVNHVVEFLNLQEKYELSRLNKIGYISAAEISAKKKTPEAKLKTSATNYAIYDPSDVHVVAHLWELTFRESFKAKDLDEYFQTLEESYIDALQATVTVCTEFVLHKILCQDIKVSST